MSRTSRYARRLTHHRRDGEVQSAVEILLRKLKNNARTITWYGSRESDAMRVEALKDGHVIRLTRYFPDSDPDYIYPMFSGPSSRDHEVLIEVKDITRRHNTYKMMYECFDEDSPLFGLARETFDVVSSGVEMKYGSSLKKRLGYIEQVEEISALFS